MISPKLLAIVFGAVAAFASGFQVATWRERAHEERDQERMDAAYRAQVDAMVKQIDAENAASAARETVLTLSIDSAKRDSESLRHEIENRPVIRQIVETPVNGQCPAVPAVDWRVFQHEFDCAATTDAKACAASSSGNSLLRVAADVGGRPRGPLDD